MSHAVGFKKTSPFLVPDLALNGDLLAQKRSGTGAAEAVSRELGTHRQQKPVQCGGADCLGEFSLTGQEFAKVFLIIGQPEFKHGQEASGTGLFTGLPDGVNQIGNRGVLGQRPRRGFLGEINRVKQPNGVFAVIIVLLAEFIQDAAAAFRTAILVTLAQPLQQLLSGHVFHLHSSILRVTFSREATNHFSPT